MAGRLGLGTAQFGLPYGITNTTGQVGEDEAAAIVLAARHAGVDTVDTAYLYGDSEAVLGRVLSPQGAMRVVTKTPKFAGLQPGEAADALERALILSLERLGRAELHALLLHDANDLLGPCGDALWARMAQLRDAGLVRVVGVSIYNGRQVDQGLDRYPLGMVQLPWNPLDRRLDEGGQLDRLRSARVEVHARSLFLQGLLLAAPEALEPRFAPLTRELAGLDAELRARGLDRLTGLFAIAGAEERIDRFIVGTTSALQFEEVARAAAVAVGAGLDFRADLGRGLDPRILDPSQWHLLA